MQQAETKEGPAIIEVYEKKIVQQLVAGELSVAAKYRVEYIYRATKEKFDFLLEFGETKFEK